MNKITLFLYSCVLSIGVSAQTQSPDNNQQFTCGFNQLFEQTDLSYLQLLEAYKAENAQRSTSSRNGVVYRVPVVFHVIYSTNHPEFNLPDSVLHDQIAVLNNAFRKRHTDTVKTRSLFKPLSVDAEIEFYLATTDSLGRPTTGITRTLSTRDYFSNESHSITATERVKKTAEGGIDPWPAKNYVNIWVANLSDSTMKLAVLGYAIPPLNPIPQNWPAVYGVLFKLLTDGIVLQTHAVGSNNPLSSATNGVYTRGRCAVHEVGHYLGLQHIFGSTNGKDSASCGTSQLSDGMNDTPEQALISQLKVCPDNAKNSCGKDQPNDLPDLWENYMDYTNDACQTLFTKDQIALMRSVLDNQRSTLTQVVTSIPEQSLTYLNVYPNPSNNVVYIPLSEKIRKAQVINYAGQVVLEFTGATTSTDEYSVEHLPTGNYVFLLETINGKLMKAKCNVVK